MYVRVKPSGAAERGIASGVVVFTVESPPGRGELPRGPAAPRFGAGGADAGR